MTTTTRKDVEQGVMALQSLAMECAKRHTIHIDVKYRAARDEVVVMASLPSDSMSGERYAQAVPLREWCSTPVNLADAVEQLAKVRKDLIALHMDQIEGVE
jgi:hypothetical protein